MFWLYDPLTFIATIIAYVVGYIALLFIAAAIAPKVATRLTNKFSLYTSMAIAMAIVFIGGLSAIYILSMLIIEFTGLDPFFLSLLIIFVIIMNVITYLLSPFMINLMYGAKTDRRLQEIVNRVAQRAGMTPPKAVLIIGPPNAFAYGNFLTGKYVAVTSSMLKITSESELEAVIGHELGHHKHRDTVIMLLMGLIPSIVYYLGLFLIRAGIFSSARSSREKNGGSPIFLIIGIAAVVFSMILQILILAFSRLREYYADAHGAVVAGVRNMQRSLAKIHLYYYGDRVSREFIAGSKLKTLFIYAFTNAVANPFFDYSYIYDDRRHIDIDRAIEQIKREEVNPFIEIFSSHPPIPKRLKFLDTLQFYQISYNTRI